MPQLSMLDAPIHINFVCPLSHRLSKDVQSVVNPQGFVVPQAFVGGHLVHDATTEWRSSHCFKGPGPGSGKAVISRTSRTNFPDL
jgi:hypothetical protein